MRTKTITVIFLIWAIVGSVYGQDSCLKISTRRIINDVERAVSIREEDYPLKKSEFFIIDITLQDTTGNIANIDYFQRNNSINDEKIKNAITGITTNWKPFCQGYKRLLIPIFIFFENVTNDEMPFQVSMPCCNEVYVFKIIMIPVSGPVR